MHKKLYAVFLTAVIFLILGAAGAFAVADVAYVLEDASKVSNDITDIIDDLGLTYEAVKDSQISSTDFSDYGLVIISEDVTNSGSIPYDEISTIFLDKEIAEKVWILGSTGKTNPGRFIEVKDESSFVFDGIIIPSDDEIQVYDGTGSEIHYINSIQQSGITIAAYRQDTTNPTIAYSTTIDGNKLRKDLFFGLVDSDSWNNDAEKMFENSLIWMMEGLDQDEDGWIAEDDCNDLDENVYPGAEEVPYDGVDQNCDGFDLTDVDEDGYESEIVGGLDCDDSDKTVNPDNPDPLLNCINDIPIVEPIETISVLEKESVEIVVTAFDPDLDDISYAIDDPRFLVDGNVLTWQTGADDHGTYTFEVSVTDGESTVKTEVEVIVENFQFPPRFSEDIPDLTWDEDGSATIDLKEYFSDDDGDRLWFGIEDTSDNDEITVYLSEDGTVTFTSVEDWSGEDWIIFYATDGLEKTVSNLVTLSVLPVNDLVVFDQDISNIEMKEDNGLENYLDLNDYFKDPDSDLSFEVFGNDKISVKIVDGKVSFYPSSDFFGVEEIYFVASDGEYTAFSNTIVLTVSDAGEPPTFNKPDCETNLIEDIPKTCFLEAQDLEGNDFSFSVDSEENLDCTINGNELTYVSEKDYFGTGSCTLAVTDVDGSAYYSLDLEISPANDAPEIETYSPNDAVVTIMEGKSQDFSVEISDVDSTEFNIRWYVDEALVYEETAQTSSYLFAGSPDNYVLRAEVYDGEFFVEHTWNVIVGPLTDYTCSEVGGFVFDDNQMCYGNILGVSDTNFCCSLAPAPSFSDSNNCDVIDDRISIDFVEPENSNDLILGETMDVELKIENNFEEDQNLDVEIYLYDTENDESVQKSDSSLELNSGSSKTLRTKIEIPNDLDLEDGKFVLFAVAEDEICFQDYMNLNIERQENEIDFSEIDFPSSAQCGETVQAKIKLENVGLDNQIADLIFANDELNIAKSFSNVYLENYGEDDSENLDFLFEIPSDAEAGTYEFDVSLEYSNEEKDAKAELEVECANEKPAEKSNPDISPPVETRIVLNEAQQSPERTNAVFEVQEKPRYSLISTLFLTELILILGLILIGFARRSK